jgi:hypothetical protein
VKKKKGTATQESNCHIVCEQTKPKTNPLFLKCCGSVVNLGKLPGFPEIVSGLLGVGCLLVIDDNVVQVLFS